MAYDVHDYDRFKNNRLAQAHEMLRERNCATYRKMRDERGLEIIAAGLNQIRAAGGGVEHIDQFADAAWQLALAMFGGS